MSWSDFAIGAQRFFFYAVTAGAAGSALVIFLLLFETIPKWENSRLKIWWIKSAQLLYLIPFAAAIVIGFRVDFTFQGIRLLSDFWRVSTLPMRRVYILAETIWLLGLVIGIVLRAIQYWKLKNILKGNVPVEDTLCQKLINEYREKYPCMQLEFFQNELINYPITVGSVKTQIILPMTNYTEKELHMVLEHEMHHVKSHDLAWKKVGLLITFIHWWNPLAYILLEKLILQVEIECDIRTCENNDHFTMKEYGFYLSGMQDGNNDMIFASALCKSKKDLFRRLEGMVRGKKYKKRTAVVSCLILSMLAAIPSYAASESVARMNEKWIAATEVETEVETVDYRALENTSTVAEEQGVEEIDLTVEGEIAPITTEITLNYTINANTRILYRWQEMQAGDTVHVSAKCSDSSIVYRVGIRDLEGNLTYAEGSGSLIHIFTIPSDGTYTVYVENRSDTSMKVTGYASYWN